MTIEKNIRMSSLTDFYQSLLTEKQLNYLEMHYLNDYSLGEIAEELGVSRQAVNDNLKRTEAVLESYELQLKLYEKYRKRTELIHKIRTQLSGNQLQSIEGFLQELEQLDETVAD